MKRTFLRILPLAVAVLLATSCSKDENNTNEVVNNGQENVQIKTLPISITVNQKGLSKLSCTGDMGADLQPIFEAGDKLAIYKGESLLKELEVTAEKISADGKTATFEGEIDAEGGLVDGVTELTAKIGTPLTEAKTATSREDAVKKGCYQTAEFKYSSTGNTIALEEQNAYIEVVWKNKGGEIVSFTIDNNSVSLTLNGQGQGWIVVPDGTSLTCEALDITDAKTTEKGNIYGISRKFVPEGYVDLGIVDKNGKDVYWAQTQNTSYYFKGWSELSDAEKADMPTKADFVDLVSNCNWVWTGSGYNVFKKKVSGTYSTESDPYISLPAVFDGNTRGLYWSSTPSSNDEAFCFDFSSDNVNYENTRGVNYYASVRLVLRSN